MGNSFCQCKTICQTKKEENLSSSNLSTTYNNNYNIKRSRNKFVNSFSSFSSSENINSIYRKNCVNKIINMYLKYKKNKIKDKKEEIQNNKFNINVKRENNKNKSKEEIEPYDNLDQYSIKHPFFIDKIHRAKTVYGKFYIPKINNGKSLEILNKNFSTPYIFQKEKNILNKRKKIKFI